MSGFFAGIFFILVIIAINEIAKNIMRKVYRNDTQEMKKLHIPFYALWLYIKFKQQQKGVRNEKDK